MNPMHTSICVGHGFLFSLFFSGGGQLGTDPDQDRNRVSERKGETKCKVIWKIVCDTICTTRMCALTSFCLKLAYRIQITITKF